MNNALVIKNEVRGTKTVVSVAGRITTDNFTQLDAELKSLDYSGLDLVLDFSEVEYITSAGLRVLLAARKKLPADRMTITHVNDAINEVFEISGFSGFFTVERDDPSPEPPADPSFAQLLDYRIRTCPDREIVFWDGKAYTWSDIDRCARIIAGDLAELGVRRGSHVAILSKNSVNWLFAFYAVQKLGAIVVLLNFSLKPEEVRMYAGIGDITHLCIGDMSEKTDREEFLSEIKKDGCAIREIYDMSSAIDFGKRYDELPALEGRFNEAFDPDDPGVMCFTSGTTGKPKGVLSSSHDRLTNGSIQLREMRVREEDRICFFLPFCHVFGFGTGLVFSLLRNTRLYITKTVSDAELIDTIQKNQCTIFNSVPTKILSIIHSEYFSTQKLASLRCSMVGGAAFSASQLEELMEKLPNVHFMPTYGMTEVAPISVVGYEDTPEHIVSTVGKPVPEIRIEIRDPATGAVCPTGTEGEIVVKSDTSLLCYYKMDVEKQAIDGEGWIPTGDLGVLCEDGYLKITGRIKDLIIRGGENIAPKEIEGFLTEQDGILDAKVVGVPDELFGEIVAAAVVMRPGTEFDRGRIDEYLRGKLANFKMPAHYVLYSAFPLMSNGKINMLEVKKDVAEKVKAGQSL